LVRISLIPAIALPVSDLFSGIRPSALRGPGSVY
jgi:hypothetical protein